MKRPAFLLILVGLFTIGLFAQAASAEISGNCTAQMSSTLTKTPVNVGGISSTSKAQAIPVPWDGTVSASATSGGRPVGGYIVELDYAGWRWKVGEGTGTGNTFTASRSVRPFATYGVGFYRIIASSEGAGCSAAAMINIVGKKPLSTLGGKVALGLSVILPVSMTITYIACGFGRGMGIPKTVTMQPERIANEWRDIRTPGQYVSWCGNAARNLRSEQIGRALREGADTFRHICRG